ncbi:hypothetical protein [Rummeliibacillus stabekisii]|uniref:hypothetical protein n=1 Tax=Rummeliibacillus stabekisii TaxID=241244 RepID=UPI001167C80A|nr:hypothetical protein [Rummeliibacillus stabekisii]MBB5171557.1 hypothetical protein [Rummeliibacillus stabekisii]GEL05525.1 hypothetical protein RST01_21520 [Rummeliibacillus stabekisii]
MLDLGEKIWDIFESLAESALNSFLKFFEIDTLKSLVFGKPNTRTELVWATFQENELTQAFSPIFNTMTTIAGFALVIFIIFAGMRFSSSSLMASRRNEFFESAKDLIFVVLLLYNLPLIYDLLFEINSAFLNIFSSAYDSPLGEFKKSYKKNGILGWIVIQLVLLGLGIWANFFYLMRKVTLVILMGIGPIMVVCWMFPRWKGITQAWFKELSGTIFIQTIHAFVFWTIAIFSKSTDGFIASVIVYIIFIPLTEQLRRLVGMGGDTTNALSKAGSMMGLAALGGMAGAVKSAMDGKSVMGALKGAYRGTKDGKGNGSDASGDGVDDKGKAMAASAGSDIGTTSRAERMLKPGDVVSRMGKAVIGAAGAIAGSATGPVGTMIGAEAGAMAGAAAGGLAGRVGGAAAQGLASRLKAGKDAVSDLNKAREQDFDEGMATLLAENDTNKWATDNKEAIMNDLKQKFPDATDKELDEKFNEVKAQKKEALMGKAKGQWADAKKVSGIVANGNQLVDASSSAMAQKWAEDNQAQFMDQYDKENPQKPGESASDFATRRMNAFNKKVDSMKDHFAAAGKEYTSQFGGNSPVSREGFNNHMAASVKGLKDDAGNVANLAAASADAVANVESPDLFTSKGVPNSNVLANSLAHVKTNQSKTDFIKNRPSHMSEAQAQAEWAQIEPARHAEHVANYSAPNFQNAIQDMKQLSLPKGTVTKLAQTAGVATGAALGVPELKQAVEVGKAGVLMGTHQLAATSQTEGILKAVPAALNAGKQGMVNQSIINQGGAVQAENSFVNSAGMAGGMLLGTKGYQVAKKFAVKHSPYKNQVESQISAPSEVIQMAQTITDDRGETKIAPGAIRQVVTQDSSHIEVLTKSGIRRVVSRMAAGHSGMNKGDVVYQDLDMQNDMLIPMNTGKGLGSYRLDSGGGRIPSSIPINTNPNNILGNPLRSGQTNTPAMPKASVLNQKVDAGNFFIENIAEEGMDKVQVVIDKGSQYVTGQKDGKTYRISPIFAGDTRIKADQSVAIPVSVKNGRLEAESNMLNSVIAKSNDSDTTDYFSSKGVKGLINDMVPSKHQQHAQKSAELRKYADQVRRKQGLLG